MDSTINIRGSYWAARSPRFEVCSRDIEYSRFCGRNMMKATHRQQSAAPLRSGRNLPTNQSLSKAVTCSAEPKDGVQQCRAGAAALAAVVALSAAQPAMAEIQPVYFGNGCFWGRQKDFVDTEMKLGREMSTATAVVGYAGGKENSKNVCYYYNAPDTLYEKQGHAEVVQVGIDTENAEAQFGMFAETYFKQFQRTPRGMIRLDPQDRGPGYRNVVGIPGGVNSELFKVFESKNVNKMNLIAGEGASFKNGKATENDAINTVYVVDSNALPFHQAEMYHQFHNGMTADFGPQYLVDMKKIKMQDGTVKSMPGCLEYPF